jgi:tetraacyldisaccharide 4'-kinase
MLHNFIRWLHCSDRPLSCLSIWLIPLLPLSVLFGFSVWLRRSLYRAGWLASVALPIPVVVIGNITIGGTGKTPLVIWLTHYLRERGYFPGVISRGHGGQAAEPIPVYAGSNPVQVGDEPPLIARHSSCPVWVGRDRVQAAQALLKAHPECNVLISDDGLQHYRLRRDVEIVVVDGAWRFGNNFLLPAGPLREPVSRLNSVDAIIINGTVRKPILANKPVYEMQLEGETFYQVSKQDHPVAAAELPRDRVVAVAGIGHPQRFFAHLHALGFTFTQYDFPDHHFYTSHDLHFPHAQVILMTEKDAVKCEKIAPEAAWYLHVDAQVSNDLGQQVLEKIGKKHGQPTA